MIVDDTVHVLTLLLHCILVLLYRYVYLHVVSWDTREHVIWPSGYSLFLIGSWFASCDSSILGDGAAAAPCVGFLLIVFY